MKICQVISSNLPIEDTGTRRWGATEIIMSEYTKHLRNLGHEVDIKWLNDVKPNQYDIVHLHVANLCIEAKKRGIEYVYHTHDHHSYHFGKNSFNYKQQLEAIKGSVFSICPAEYVVDYFDDTDKLFFLPHGVDTKYYTPIVKPVFSVSFEHKLLMCANNGLAGNAGIDRKGFRFGIEAAKRLNMPITIVGADGNKAFFEIHKDLLEYDRLTVIDNNPTEEVKREIFKEHTIFVHPSNLEFGEPCLTLLEAASMCMPIVGTYRGSKHFNGMWVIPAITTDSVVVGIEETIKTYHHRRNEMLEVRESLDWSLVVKRLESMYSAVLKMDNYSSASVTEQYLHFFNS
jgi:glycosyltransferase involved in cell wall biosynthesis